MNVVFDKLNFCKSCGVVHGTVPITPEYIHFYENMHKIKKKNVYHRKYHIRNKIIDVVQESGLKQLQTKMLKNNKTIQCNTDGRKRIFLIQIFLV